MFKLRISLIFALGLLNQGATGKTTTVKPAPAAVKAPLVLTVPEAKPMPQTAIKPETIQNLASLCQQYEGKYLAYYDAVFKVQGCKRFALNTAEIYALSRTGISPFDKRKEMAKIIQTIPLGGQWSSEVEKQTPLDPCTTFDHSYVTDGVEAYWVEKCSLQKFPDWASYEDHRGSLGKNPPNLRYLEPKQLELFKPGKDLPSVLDGEYRELVQVPATLSSQEACKGLVGGYVSYLDTVYFIEATAKGCTRRAVNGELFTGQRGHDKFTLAELSSEQALAIPEGKKYKLSKGQ